MTKHRLRGWLAATGTAAALVTLAWLAAGLPGEAATLPLRAHELGASGAHRPRVNPGVLPPQSHPHGATYGEWSGRWWQWVFLQPADGHPLFEDGTVDCSKGQSGHVWFLGGTFDTTGTEEEVIGQATRQCMVPPGTALFFPLLNVAALVPSEGETIDEVREVAADIANSILPDTLFAEVDGVPLENLHRYRVASPAFTYGPLPEDNVLGAPAGATDFAVSDGYFLMLAPLAAGPHTIRFGGMLDYQGFVFILDITYHITVAPPRGR